MFFAERADPAHHRAVAAGAARRDAADQLLHFQTLIASKAARMVLAAPGKLLVDFGLRRAHGAEAGLMAARASYIAGFAGTATMLAEQASAFRSTARWRIRSSRPTTTKPPHSKLSPSPGPRISRC